MGELFSNFVQGLTVAWPQFSQGAVFFFWPLLLAFLLSLSPLLSHVLKFLIIISYKVARQAFGVLNGKPVARTPTPFSIDSTEFLEFLFFAVFGIAIAYIEVRVGGLLVQGVLPGVLTVATVLAQLVGRAVPSMDAPLDKRKSLANASLVCVGFLIAYEYFSISDQAQNGKKAPETTVLPEG